MSGPTTPTIVERGSVRAVTTENCYRQHDAVRDWRIEPADGHRCYGRAYGMTEDQVTGWLSMMALAHSDGFAEAQARMRGALGL